MTEEQVFLEEGGMFVSISRVILSGTTYSTANITSVSKRVRPAKTGCATTLVVVGILWALGALAAASSEDLGMGVINLVFGIVILVVGVLWLRSLKPTFLVVFASASGEREALNSKDEELIDRVVNSVNRAIVARG